MRLTQTSWIVCLGSAVLLLAFGSEKIVASGPSSETTHKKTEFGEGVKVGSSLGQYSDTCVMFRVYFISGDFFIGLHRPKGQGGSDFKRGNARLSVFPDRLIVDIEATAYRCSNPANTSLDFGQGLLADSNFKIYRKSGAELHPINILSKQIRHRSLGLRWDYFLEIPTKDIPLAEELVVDVLMRGLNNQIRLSARL